jgi:hypothetical protein
MTKSFKKKTNLVRENIAEDVAGYDDIELLRVADELHRRVVHVPVISSIVLSFCTCVYTHTHELLRVADELHRRVVQVPSCVCMHIYIASYAHIYCVVVYVYAYILRPADELHRRVVHVPVVLCYVILHFCA